MSNSNYQHNIFNINEVPFQEVDQTEQNDQVPVPVPEVTGPVPYSENYQVPPIQPVQIPSIPYSSYSVNAPNIPIMNQVSGHNQVHQLSMNQAPIPMSQVTMNQMPIQKTNPIQNSQIQNSQIQNSQIQNSQIQGSQLQGSQLQGSQLQGSQLQGSQLQGSQMQGSQIQSQISGQAPQGLPQIPQGLPQIPQGIPQMPQAPQNQPVQNPEPTVHPVHQPVPPVHTAPAQPIQPGSNQTGIQISQTNPIQNVPSQTTQVDLSYNDLYYQPIKYDNHFNFNMITSQAPIQLPVQQSIQSQISQTPIQTPKRKKSKIMINDMKPETAARNRCPICQKQFKRPSSLQTHIYSHTGEKLFKCPWVDCGRLFSVKSNMTRHTRIHERDMKFNTSSNNTNNNVP